MDKLKDSLSFPEIAKEAKNQMSLFTSEVSMPSSKEKKVTLETEDRPDFTAVTAPPYTSAVQTELLKELKKTGKPLIVVNMSGSVMSFEWESEQADAILQAWYGGQAGGDAIVDVLFGEYNPAGRMPLTTYQSDADLPPFEDYSMANRTYRYFKGEPLLSVRICLSYTTLLTVSLNAPPK